MKNVLIYGTHSTMHSSLKILLKNPPKGYQFILEEDKKKKNLFSFLKYLQVLTKINNFFIKPLFYKKLFYLHQKFTSSKIPQETDLIFSCGRIPPKISLPFIIEILDHPASITGYNYKLFVKMKKKIENELNSPLCKKIILVNEASQKFMKDNFNKKTLDKCVLVRASLNEQKYKKEYSKKKLQILFMGSLANPNDFYIKGGLEAVESFLKLQNELKNAKLIVRCKIPKKIKKKYSLYKNLFFLEKELPQEELEQIARETDISLQPGHVYPLMGCLEPMSYGIPIIALDTWGMRDYLTEKNAILISPSIKIEGYFSKEYPLNIRSKKFINQIKKIDQRVISDLTLALKKLIKNPKLRKSLGEEGRKIIKRKFTIKKRSKELKKIFDNALKD